jgi:hypothetical protein
MRKNKMFEFNYQWVEAKQVDTLLNDIRKGDSKQRRNNYRKWRRRQRIGAFVDWMLGKFGL